MKIKNRQLRKLIREVLLREESTKKDKVKKIQSIVGTDVDGVWGSKTNTAWQKHLLKHRAELSKLTGSKLSSAFTSSDAKKSWSSMSKLLSATDKKFSGNVDGVLDLLDYLGTTDQQSKKDKKDKDSTADEDSAPTATTSDQPFILPVTPFKVTAMPYDGHDGVDVGTPEGTPYLAVHDGKIVAVRKGTRDTWSNNYQWYFRKKGFGSGTNNIVYQAFPSLRVHVNVAARPDTYNLFSGIKGLDKFWDEENQKFTGTEQDVIALIDAAPSIPSRNASTMKKAAKASGARNIGSKYGHSGLEHSKGGDSVTLSFEDPLGGETRIYCAHMEEVNVSKGDVVKQGDMLGTVGGKSGRTTGPHVHISLQYYKGKTGVSENPTVYRDFMNRIVNPAMQKPKLG